MKLLQGTYKKEFGEHYLDDEPLKFLLTEWLSSEAVIFNIASARRRRWKV